MNVRLLWVIHFLWLIRVQKKEILSQDQEIHDAAMPKIFGQNKDQSIASWSEILAWFSADAWPANRFLKRDSSEGADWVSTIDFTDNSCKQGKHSSRENHSDCEARARAVQSEFQMNPWFTEEFSETVTSGYLDRTPPIPRSIFTAETYSHL